MKKITTKLVLRIILLVSVVAVAFSTFSFYYVKRSTSFAIETTLTEVAKIAADNIAANINTYASKIEKVGLVSGLLHEEMSIEEKSQTLTDLKQNLSFDDLVITDLSGNFYVGTTTDIPDFKNETFFQKAVNKQTAISTPIKDKQSGGMHVYVASPVWLNGKVGDTVQGVVIGMLRGSIFSDLTDTIRVGEKGDTFLIDNSGTLIGYNNHSLVEMQNNLIEQSKTEKSLLEIADVQKKLANGETGYQAYQYQGTAYYAAYTPIKGTDGWGIGVAVQKKEFDRYANRNVNALIIFTAEGLIAAFIISWVFSKRIVNPIIANIKRLQQLSEGDFTSPVPEVKSKDETRQLADAIATTIDRMKQIIFDIDYNLQQISHKNLDVAIQTTYPGDLATIQSAINTLVLSLSDTLGQIHIAAGQVETGAAEVSLGAQAISQGSTEQASSIQELSAAIQEISDNVRQTAENANGANSIVTEVGSGLETSYDKMRDLMAAMEQINLASQEISKIIKAIDDIAFQTNILALNAAVEAARAGTAGKGFAVVAEEVRNLATRSAEAAKHTTELIENSLEAVEKGISLANQTVDSMEKVVADSKVAGTLIADITSAANSQATSITQVTQGVQQISAVAQNNSATVEESTAALEELNAQAEELNALVRQFKLYQKEFHAIIEEEESVKEESVATESPVVTTKRSESKY